VRVRNRDGAADNSSQGGAVDNSSTDPIFNTLDNVNAGVSMFYQDDYPLPNPIPDPLGLEEETSTHSFYIYDKELFEETDTIYFTYIRNLQPAFVSPYSGQLIKRQ